jgi:hypothetical protein
MFDFDILTPFLIFFLLFILPILFMGKRTPNKGKYVWALVILFIPLYGFLGFWCSITSYYLTFKINHKHDVWVDEINDLEQKNRKAK